MEVQDACPEALVVVDEVEVGSTLIQNGADALRVGKRLAEPRGEHDAELFEIFGAGELPGVRDAKGVRIPVEVHPANRREADTLINLRPWGSGEHLDGVTKRHELA